MTLPVEARIIPARAGFTSWWRGRSPATPDHPRSRGVYSISWCARGRSAGSSPLARGLPARTATIHDLWRIIPARAGFTLLGDHGPDSSTDHPRSRGVYRSRQGGDRGLEGSSPLARGLPRDVVAAMVLRGIIPARAGFTTDDGHDDDRGADHPRSRGVYRKAAVSSGRRLGSSPLARGLPALRI